MRLLAKKTWDKIRGEVRGDIEKQIQLLQSTLNEFDDFDVKKCVPISVHLYQKYHNKDSCMGCYYAEDDYDIVAEFPMSSDEFLDMYITFTIQNHENTLVETKLLYKAGQYTKEIPIADEEINKIWNKVRETKRAKELADLSVRWDKKCSKESTLTHTIEYIEKKLSQTNKYTDDYLKHYREKQKEAEEELKSLEDPKLQTYFNLLRRTNRFTEEVY